MSKEEKTALVRQCVLIPGRLQQRTDKTESQQEGETGLVRQSADVCAWGKYVFVGAVGPVNKVALEPTAAPVFSL